MLIYAPSGAYIIGGGFMVGVFQGILDIWLVPLYDLATLDGLSAIVAWMILIGFAFGVTRKIVKVI